MSISGALADARRYVMIAADTLQCYVDNYRSATDHGVPWRYVREVATDLYIITETLDANP